MQTVVLCLIRLWCENFEQNYSQHHDDDVRVLLGGGWSPAASARLQTVGPKRLLCAPRGCNASPPAPPSPPPSSPSSATPARCSCHWGDSKWDGLLPPSPPSAGKAILISVCDQIAAQAPAPSPIVPCLPYQMKYGDGNCGTSNQRLRLPILLWGFFV